MRILAFALFILLFCAMPASAQDEDRVASAREQSEPAVRARFREAKVKYPAGEIFIRVFKREAVVELWARAKAGEAFRLVHTYTVTRSSGGPGPKRVEGDLQVPEGFYEVDRFNPKSLFHLSLGINYPNAADRILSDAARPGFDIFLHGSAVSVGCVPVGDSAIEEIFLATLDSVKRPPHVHIFPARMNAADWTTWRDEQLKAKPELGAFWAQLQAGFNLFEKTKRVPVVNVESDGRYKCRAGR